jgi:Domain of unknown function (DUF5666)
MRKWFENRNLRIAGIVVGAAVVLLLVFGLGVVVGASAFRPLGRGPLPFLFFRLQGGHGAVGKVTRINGNTITLTNPEEQAMTIAVTHTTRIEGDRRQHMRLQDIQVGDHIIVIGSPQGNVIQAQFIRVFRRTPTETPLQMRFIDRRAVLAECVQGAREFSV